MADRTHIDISTMSSDEIINYYIKLLCKKAEIKGSDAIDGDFCIKLALVHIARSLDQLEYRMFHIINSLEGIRAVLERKE